MVTRHFDGEFFDRRLEKGAVLTILSGIRPEVTAVLTLKNDAVGGGTRLFPEHGGESFVLEGRPGDLVVFNNVKYEHGVDELKGETTDGWLRYIVGWRPFEDRCWYYEEGKRLRKISVAKAATLHRKFLKEKWPDLQRKGPGRAAF